MSAPQHTPGPWTAGNTFPTVSDWTGRMIAECPVSTSDLDAKDDAFTNARLIAAAPELYEAGAALIERMFDTLSNGKGIEADDGEKCWIVHSDDIEELRAALAKARGDA